MKGAGPISWLLIDVVSSVIEVQKETKETLQRFKETVRRHAVILRRSKKTTQTRQKQASQ